MQKKSGTWPWVVGGIIGLVVFGLAKLGHDPAEDAAYAKTVAQDAAKQVAADKLQASEDAAQKKREAKEAKELKAEEAVRGPKPAEPVEGESCSEVDAYFDEHLKDRGSLNVVAAGKILPNGPDSWMQHVKYRAKNSFGALELADQVFVIRDGKVIDVVDMASGE